MQSNLIDQGFSLMLYGMGTVFVFLTVLVFATTLMSRVVTRINPGSPALTDDEQEAKLEAPMRTSTTQLPAEIKTVIEHAIAMHRKR